MKGFIVDQDDDAEGREDNASEKSDLEEDLDEDDLDLIEENLDVKGQLKKHKRVAHIDDSDEEPVDDRTAIGQDLFGMGLDDDEPPSSRREPVPEERSDDEGSESDGSRADDFIEYDKDERRGVRERHKKRKENNFAEGFVLRTASMVSFTTRRCRIIAKVADGIYCHVDVLEQEKEKPFTLGKKLIILE